MGYRSGRKASRRKGKHKRWQHGLCFGSNELGYVAHGGGCEAYSYTYRRGSPTGRHRKGARKELRQRIKRDIAPISYSKNYYLLMDPAGMKIF